MLEISASEEVDVFSIEAEDIEASSPLHVPDYEELVEVVTHTLARLNINWPCGRQEAQSKSKLNDCFLT